MLFSLNDIAIKSTEEDSVPADGRKSPAGNLSFSLDALEPDTTYHFITNKHWSLHEMLTRILELTGPAKVMFTTWAISEDPLRSIIEHVEKKRITELKCVFNHRVKIECPKAYQLAQFNISDIRLAKIHAKILVVQGAEKSCAILSTANLTRNPRIEAYAVFTDSGTVEFYRSTIQKIHEHGDSFE